MSMWLKMIDYKNILANLTDNQFLIYIMIEINPNFTTIKYIKNLLNISKNSIIKILNELEKLNLIIKIKRNKWKGK